MGFKDAKEVDYTPLTPVRKWSEPWYACCGKCDSRGWGVGCLTHFLPCVTFGMNRNRAFNGSVVLWAAFYILIGFIGHQLFKMFAVDILEIIQLPTFLYKYGYDERVPVQVGVRSVIALVIFSLVILFSFGYTVLGCWNRSSMREKYGLPGNHTADCLLWTFCRPCALCQEARTLLDNNVVDGVWMGPEGLVARNVYTIDPSDDSHTDGVKIGVPAMV